METLNKHLGINLTVVDASDEFLEKLAGVEDPEKKRKIIGNTFIHVFQREAKKLTAGHGKDIDYLLQGALYSDVIESISFKGPSQAIKTHHNVGGLLENMKLKLIEPLRELFKDEVRKLGSLMGITDDLFWRQHFPDRNRHTYPRRGHQGTSRHCPTSRPHLHRRNQKSGYLRRNLPGIRSSSTHPCRRCHG